MLVVTFDDERRNWTQCDLQRISRNEIYHDGRALMVAKRELELNGNVSVTQLWLGNTGAFRLVQTAARCQRKSTERAISSQSFGDVFDRPPFQWADDTALALIWKLSVFAQKSGETVTHQHLWHRFEIVI
jgi:hypothetical protein